MKRKNKIDGISIQNFVEYYLGTKHDCFMLKHQGLKSFNNPYLVGVSNDFAIKNPDYIVKNELIRVIDDYGNPGTYINPHYIKKLMELEVCKEKIKILSSINCHDFEEASLLYKIWAQLNNEVEFLEELYGNIYELFYLINKNKLLRSINRDAKEEARRTLIFTCIKESKLEEKVKWVADYNELDSCSSELDMILPEDSLEDYEDYKATAKVNRLKKYSYR